MSNGTGVYRAQTSKGGISSAAYTQAAATAPSRPACVRAHDVQPAGPCSQLTEFASCRDRQCLLQSRRATQQHPASPPHLPQGCGNGLVGQHQVLVRLEGVGRGQDGVGLRGGWKAGVKEGCVTGSKVVD
jgi:hypothetical protein